MAQETIQGRGSSKKYCLVRILDIKNAFNTANWSHILQALTAMRVPKYFIDVIADYFRCSILVYDTDRGPKEHKITGGVPQGSVLGPLLWNVMYDGILRFAIPDETKIVGFALLNCWRRWSR